MVSCKCSGSLAPLGGAVLHRIMCHCMSFRDKESGKAEKTGPDHSKSHFNFQVPNQYSENHLHFVILLYILDFFYNHINDYYYCSWALAMCIIYWLAFAFTNNIITGQYKLSYNDESNYVYWSICPGLFVDFQILVLNSLIHIVRVSFTKTVSTFLQSYYVSNYLIIFYVFQWMIRQLLIDMCGIKL